MNVDKKEKQIIEQALNQWRSNKLLDAKKAKELSDSLVSKPFNWKSVAFYSFIFAFISLVVAVLSIIADKELLQFIDMIVESSYLSKSIFFLVLTMIFYWLDIKKSGQKKLNKKYSRYIYALLACISFSLSIGIFSFVLNNGEQPGLMIFLSSVVFIGIALYRRNEVYWLFGLVAMLVAYGVLSSEMANKDNLFLGMNIILRYAVFSALLLLITYSVKAILYPFYHYTFNALLITTFLFLWLVSISGNYANYNDWLEIKQYQLWFYSFVLLVAAIVAIMLGIKKEDSWLRNVGVIFIFLNLYTRYFEFFWDSLHKAVFFAVIAGSFWLVGKKAEKIWSKNS